MNLTDKEKFFSMLFHDDKNSNYILQQFNSKKFYKAVKVKDLATVKIPEEDAYISINGFSGYRRKTSECRQINALFFDLDAHDSEDTKRDIGHTYFALKDAIEEKRLKKPNLIIYSGRGLHLYYILEKSITYLLKDKSKNAVGLEIRKRIIDSISNDINDILAEADCKLELDKKVSDITRIARIPGTKNSKSGTKAWIIDYDEDYYVFDELLEAVKKKKRPAPKKIPVVNEYGPALHKIRIAELEKLQEYRKFDCRGCKENMCFMYYNAAVHIYDREVAYKKLVSFRNKFNDVHAVPDSQLKALSQGVDNNKTSDYEGYYMLTKDWIIEALGVTPDEIAELGLFQLSKRELKKQQNKIDKQKQAMQVIEFAKSGMKHQVIAETVGISKGTVQNILKKAGLTRKYNCQAA